MGLTKVAKELGRKLPGDVRETKEMSFIDTNGCCVMTRWRFVYQPLPQHYPVQGRRDIDFARRSLNWQLCVPPEDGLVRTITYFERSKGKEAAPIRSAASSTHGRRA